MRLFPAITCLLVAGFTLIAPQPAHAAAWLEAIGVPDGQLVPAACTDSDYATECTLDELTTVVVNVITILLGISGSFALLMFTYAGFTMLLARGNSDDIQKAKQILSMAVMGIVIIFSAYMIVAVVRSVLITGTVAGS